MLRDKKRPSNIGGAGRITASPLRKASVLKCCPVCRQERSLGRALVLSVFGRVFPVEVCPICEEAMAANNSYRASVAHQIAQASLYGGANAA